MNTKIKLYGIERCHKTKYYQKFLEKQNLDFDFLDVEENKVFADELRSHYENGKLNFPTLIIGTKKVRNPSDRDLKKWINKIIKKP